MRTYVPKERFHKNGEMENNCINLLTHVFTVGMKETTINQLSRDCGVPRTSLQHILNDAFEDKTHSTLFIYAMKYGYDFKIFAGYSSSNSRASKTFIIDVVRFDWLRYKYPEE